MTLIQEIQIGASRRKGIQKQPRHMLRSAPRYSLRSNKFPRTKLNVPHGNIQRSVGAKPTWARGLVANSEVKAAQFVNAPMARWIKDIVEFVILRDEAVRLSEACGDVVHAVSRQQR